MALTTFFSAQRNKDSQEYYWTLIIEPGWVQSGIWSIKDGAAEVIAIGPATYWETPEDLINSSDATLSSCIQSLPEGLDIEPTKTVFGVPPSWVAESQIKKEYLEGVRKICSTLSLEPSGFVVLPESIAHFIKAEEGSPLSAIVVGTSRETIDVSLFRLGNLAGTTTITRSVSIVDDVVEGLARFATNEAFPSRLIIYDGKEGDLEGTKQAILDADWTGDKAKFLHTPKVEIMEPDRKILAVSLAGASELENITKLIPLSKKVKDGVGEGETKQEEIIEDGHENVVPTKDLSANDVGFVIGEDVSEIKKEDQVEMAKKQPASPAQVETYVPKDVAKVVKNGNPVKGLTQKVRGVLSKITKLIPQKGERATITDFGGERKKRVFSVSAVLILIALIGGLIFWWRFPKAEVTIFVSPKKIEEPVDITIDPDQKEVNVDSKTVPGEVLTTTASGEKTKGTTGTKVVGEKAKGSVKIRNGTSVIVNLSSGTTLVGPNNLKFTLNNSASISAALSPSNPGTAIIGATADAIGAEYNLAKDESFKVANYPKSEVDAIADGNFSGGTSKEISAVATEDRKSLLDELTKELLEKGKTELSKKAKEGDYFISEATVATASSTNFNHKVGDEADTLKLALDTKITGVSVLKEDLDKLTMEILKVKTPGGFVLRQEQVKFSFTIKGVEGKKIKVEAKLTANLLPEVKPDEIAKAISGKYPSLARDYLSSLPGFSRAEINLKPKFPGRLGILPKIPKNITIEVAAED